MLKGSQTPIRLRDLSLEAHQRFLGFGLAPKSFLLFPSPYRGRHYWVPSTQRLFGGQIVGQALVAAAKSVSEDVHVHSLHCYFVRTGKPPPPYPTPALVAQAATSPPWGGRGREVEGGGKGVGCSREPREEQGLRPGRALDPIPAEMLCTCFLAHGGTRLGSFTVARGFFVLYSLHTWGQPCAEFLEDSVTSAGRLEAGSLTWRREHQPGNQRDFGSGLSFARQP